MSMGFQKLSVVNCCAGFPYLKMGKTIAQGEGVVSRYRGVGVFHRCSTSAPVLGEL